MPGGTAHATEPSAAEIDVVMRGFKHASSGNGKVYTPPTSFATGRVRFWIGRSKSGGIRACVFRFTPGSRPIHEINDAPSERAAIAKLIKWARANPEPDEGKHRTTGAAELLPARLHRFRKRFRLTRSGSGYVYIPGNLVGPWQVCFWIGVDRRPERTPACIYRRRTDSGKEEQPVHYFRTPLDAYAAMLSWADNRGWSSRSDFPSSRMVPGAPRHPVGEEENPLPVGPAIEDLERRILLTPRPNIDWPRGRERNDWDAGDWELFIDSAIPGNSSVSVDE